jgi:hypothetical protein
VNMTTHAQLTESSVRAPIGKGREGKGIGREGKSASPPSSISSSYVPTRATTEAIGKRRPRTRRLEWMAGSR